MKMLLPVAWFTERETEFMIKMLKGKKRLLSVPAVWLDNSNIHSFNFLFLVLEFYYYRNCECWDLKHWHSLYLKRYDSLIHYVILLHLREMHNTLQLPVFLFSFFSFFCQPYPEYRRIRSKKIFYRPSNSWYNSVICSYKKEIFWVYSFSEQVAAKGNSQEASW